MSRLTSIIHRIDSLRGVIEQIGIGRGGAFHGGDYTAGQDGESAKQRVNLIYLTLKVDNRPPIPPAGFSSSGSRASNPTHIPLLMRESAGNGILAENGLVGESAIEGRRDLPVAVVLTTDFIPKAVPLSEHLERQYNRNWDVD
jgi:hypothetical protein